jgi:hypothetical protein
VVVGSDAAAAAVSLLDCADVRKAGGLYLTIMQLIYFLAP